jgi:DNA polymerase-3 subunit alpha
VAEWPAATIAAFELAHLGFYASAPLAVDAETEALAEQQSGLRLVELADLPERAPVTVAALITNLRVRRTKKGDLMAWLTLADGTGAIDAIAFPSTYAKIVRRGPLSEGLVVLARGKVNHEEGAGPKLFLDQLEYRDGSGGRISALVAAVNGHQDYPLYQP